MCNEKSGTWRTAFFTLKCKLHEIPKQLAAVEENYDAADYVYYTQSFVGKTSAEEGDYS